VAAHLPGHRTGSVVPAGAGLDHAAYEVDGELIVRFDHAPDPAARPAAVEREARLLAAVAAVSPLPVPEPAFADAGLGCLAYRRLPGIPLLDVPGPRRAACAAPVAAALGELLAALHRAPVDRLAGLVDAEDRPPAEWLREAKETFPAVAGEVPAARRAAVETFLAAPPPDPEHAPAFSHNDLGIEHVLVDPATCAVTGVIDWSDAAIVDPASDFGRVYRDLGPAAVDAALAAYGAEPAGTARLRERATFYARCALLEDLAYGLETGRNSYASKSLAALAWLFPA
jgi:aminoglycoside phosphotransferase (APT) family kinase protein